MPEPIHPSSLSLSNRSSRRPPPKNCAPPYPLSQALFLKLPRAQTSTLPTYAFVGQVPPSDFLHFPRSFLGLCVLTVQTPSLHFPSRKEWTSFPNILARLLPFPFHTSSFSLTSISATGAELEDCKEREEKSGRNRENDITWTERLSRPYFK